jgi:hypothetical protein
MQPSAGTQDRHRIGAHCGAMTSTRLRIARRAQAAVVGLGIAGALGAAVAIGLGGTAAGTTSDDNEGWTPQNGTGRTGTTPQQEPGDDDGGRVAPAPQRSQQAPSAPQPGTGTGGSGHATTQGS